MPAGAERYEPVPMTTPTRHPERATYDRAAVHAVLDEALICHVGTVVDDRPVVLPMIHARVGEVLYLHLSTGARLARSIPDDGLPVCLTVTLVEGLVLARSQFHHSLNYRSVVVHGRAEPVTDPEERVAALAALVDHIVPGRSAATRPVTGRELAATAVIRVPLREVSMKLRDGDPSDDDADLTLPHWAGVIPVATAFGSPRPAPGLATGIDLPRPVAEYRRPGRALPGQ